MVGAQGVDGDEDDGRARRRGGTSGAAAGHGHEGSAEKDQRARAEASGETEPPARVIRAGGLHVASLRRNEGNGGGPQKRMPSAMRNSRGNG